jgi:ArsR family transcriptional regulator
MTTAPDLIHESADRFKMLGHPVRLQILDVLRRSPECVCHLEAALHKPQPYISQQLRVLREAGVIVDVKEGANVYYHLVDPNTARFLDAALGPVAAGAPPGRESIAGCSCPKCGLPEHAAIRLVD